MIPSAPPALVLMEDFFAAASRGLVSAQRSLDDEASRSLTAWEEDGVPPCAWAVSSCRFGFPISLECAPKAGVQQSTSLWLQQAGPSGASLTVNIRYQMRPLEEE